MITLISPPKITSVFADKNPFKLMLFWLIQKLIQKLPYKLVQNIYGKVQLWKIPNHSDFDIASKTTVRVNINVDYTVLVQIH